MAAGTRLNEIQYSMLEEQADRMISIFSITYWRGPQWHLETINKPIPKITLIF